MTLGWIRLDYSDGPVFAYVGFNDRPGGEQTIAWFDPKRRHGVMVLTSGRSGHRLYVDVLDLIDPGSPVAAFFKRPE